MPSADVLTLLDQESAQQLDPEDIKQIECNGCLKIVRTESGSAMFRNRWMKTKLRKLIEGEFLYLDSDLVVRADLSDVWNTSGDLAGVLDREQKRPYFAPADRRRYDAMGWRLPTHGSVNGGVLFWRESSAAHRLAETYHFLWSEVCSQTDRCTDQQALNKAIEDCAVNLELLPSTFNAMERYHPRHISSAKVWHFIFSNARSETRNNTTHWEAVIRGEREEPEPQGWAALNYPWIIRDPVGWLCMHSLRRSKQLNYIKDWRRLWLIGERTRSVKALLKLVTGSFLAGMRGKGKA